jgi:hypothetical protein
MHIDAIVTYAVDNQIHFYCAHQWEQVTSRNCQEIGRMLLDENVRSVKHRYPDDTDDTLPGRCGETASGYTFKRFDVDLMPVEIIKLCHCLAYQCCEPDDWDETPSASLLKAIESKATSKLPGYESAPWGMNEFYKSKLRNVNMRRLTALV